MSLLHLVHKDNLTSSSCRFEYFSDARFGFQVINYSRKRSDSSLGTLPFSCASKLTKQYHSIYIDDKCKLYFRYLNFLLNNPFPCAPLVCVEHGKWWARFYTKIIINILKKAVNSCRLRVSYEIVTDWAHVYTCNSRLWPGIEGYPGTRLYTEERLTAPASRRLISSFLTERFYGLGFKQCEQRTGRGFRRD